jgi:co-chaperonin GroES (HSP10)
MQAIASEPETKKIPKRLQPKGNRLLVRMYKKDNLKTDGGVHLAETMKISSNYGTVVAFGEGKWVGDTLVPVLFELCPDDDEPIKAGVAVGDIILLSGAALCDTVMVEGEFLFIVNGDDVIAIEKEI